MSNWLTKASNTFSRSAPKEPEPFEIPCQCGQTVRGMRQAYFQRVVCEDCGERLFVLPLDVYPELKPKNRRKRKAKKGQTLAKAKTAAQAAARKVGPVLRKHAHQQARNVSEKTAAVSRRVTKWFRSTFTPFRLVMMCIVAVVASTGYWAAQSIVRERAETALRAAEENGRAALRQRKFLTAERELRIACEALDRLGRDDAPAREVRQLWRETVALTNQLDPSLFELIEEAERKTREGPAAWAEHFESHYAGKWLAIETFVRRASGDAGDSRYAIVLPLGLGVKEGTQIDFRGDLAVFDRLEISDESRLVAFAAELAGCRRAPVDPSRWVIVLRPDNGILWTDFENYSSAGLGPDEDRPAEEIRQLLLQQSRSMEIAQ